MERVLSSDQYSDIVAMTMMIYSLPRMASGADALVVFPGQGEKWRTKHAVRTWEHLIKRDGVSRFLLVAGGNPDHKTETYTKPLLQESFGLKGLEFVCVQVNAESSKDQADWVADMVIGLEICNIALFVSPYHLLRAYLTLV